MLVFLFFPITKIPADEGNVTDLLFGKGVKSWKRPVKHFETTVNVGIGLYILRVIKVDDEEELNLLLLFSTITSIIKLSKNSILTWMQTYLFISIFAAPFSNTNVHSCVNVMQIFKQTSQEEHLNKK